jgi:putative ABC transport system ATP-binding protein
MNGWEEPTEGTVLIEGEDIYKKDEDGRARMKHHMLSLVHQSSNWVKALNVVENIAIPYILAGRSKKEGFQRAMHLLEMLHLDKYAYYKPMDLSGGQQQRVSFLRALINNPKIIMADEPTGNLDSSASQVIMELFSKINHELGRTIVMVTHNLELLNYASKTVNIIDGKIVKVEQNKKYHKEKAGEKKDVLEIAFNKFQDKDEEEERELSKIR